MIEPPPQIDITEQTFYINIGPHQQKYYNNNETKIPKLIINKQFNKLISENNLNRHFENTFRPTCRRIVLGYKL